jgi:hypothetical protein
MEWHDGIVEPLADILRSHNFEIKIYGENPEFATGMIFAKK